MIIEKISKKDERTVVIHLNEGEPLFLSYEIFLKNGLRKNDEISEDRFLFLIEENRKYYIKQKAINYIARRMHSIYEIKTKLMQKGYEKRLIEPVLTEMAEKNILDDKAFALQFAEEKIRLKLWGKSKLRAELMKKGIAREIIDEVLFEIFPEGNDIEKAITLAEKKIGGFSFKNLPAEKKKLKLFSFLSSRGYDYETIKIVSEKLLKNDEDEF